MKKIIASSSMIALFFGVVGVASAFTYVTTNADNIANEEGPYVEEVSSTPSEVTLGFGNFGPGVHCFEYRTDGDTSQSIGTNSFFPELDLYPYFCLSAGGTDERTFDVDEYIEIRIPFGAEQDFYFDWTRFDAPSCKKGGWENFTDPTFDNQGMCVSYFKSNENAGIRSGENPRGR